ncbi:MAG: hypothetical protein IPK52_07065 [Chloroflexi bacterium]|nr:hypothetical protein [Chloroflexota bacterium]
MSIIDKQIQAAPHITGESACEKSGCCSTTEEGNAVCMVAQSVEAESCGCDSGASSCGCNSAATLEIDAIHTVKVSFQPKNTLSARIAECKTMWLKIRGGVMFVVACIASPCCTPLIVPIVLAMLAGTPAALWLGQNLGWVFGGLTLLSVVSFVLAFRWMGTNGRRRTVLSVIQSSVTSTAKRETRSQSL